MDVEENDRQLGQPYEVAESLKCPVCWDYFEKPHTLCCGHTFCLRCLQNLARITRSSKTRTPLDRLRMCCPACRKRTLVRPILKRRVALNYAIKQFMNDWLDSPLSSGYMHYITLRSVGSQTDNLLSVDLDTAKVQASLKDSETQQDEVSATEQREIAIYKLDNKCKSKEDVKERLTDVNADEILTTEADDHVSASDENQASSSSGEESEQDMQIGPMFARLVNDEDADARRRRIRFFSIASVPGVLGMLFLELSVVYRGITQSRSRTILTLFWFFYGGIIVYMSRAFLPWMTFYTAIYFIIIYVEVSPGPLFR